MQHTDDDNIRPRRLNHLNRSSEERAADCDAGARADEGIVEGIGHR